MKRQKHSVENIDFAAQEKSKKDLERLLRVLKNLELEKTPVSEELLKELFIKNAILENLILKQLKTNDTLQKLNDELFEILEERELKLKKYKDENLKLTEYRVPFLHFNLN